MAKYSKESVCEVDNNSVIRMKCFPTLACLSWLFFPPDDRQVEVCASLCLCACTVSSRGTYAHANTSVCVCRCMLWSCLHCADAKMSTESRRGHRAPPTHGSCGRSQMFIKHKVNHKLPLAHVLNKRQEKGESEGKYQHHEGCGCVGFNYHKTGDVAQTFLWLEMLQ